MLRWLEVKVESQSEDDALRLMVTGPAQWAARDLRVPGDISSAAFFLAAAVMLPDSEVVLPNIGLNPTRTKVLSVLRGLGGEIMTEDERTENNEPMGTLRVRGTGLLQGTNTLQAPVVAALIDELPMLAVLGTQIKGGLSIRDAGELRVKESDRIATTVSNLRAMGAQVEEYSDGLSVAGPVPLRGAHLDSYGDHRIAMAFAVAALVAEGPSEISGAECAAVSFPEFFTLLESLAQR
jgi:3-phosphoshikimate 1-carboxyvinyltransferase